MKRHLSLLLVVAMLLGSFSFAFAAKDVNPVDFLVDEGIIVGDEKTGDLMLYHPLKRQDSVVMLSRLMGEESIAKNFKVTARFPSFTDIKDPYYKPYIGWAEANEYVKGHSGKRAGEFGYNDYLTARQYAIILLRALGYVDEADNWNEAYSTASRLGLLDNVRASRDGEILRIEMAQMTYNALGTKINHSEKTLAEKLGIDMPVDKPATFELADIKADNLKEVAVIFNQKVDEATVTDSNIKIKDGSRDIAGTATLQDDGYTVIVRVKEGALTNQKGYKVVVEKVKSIYGVEIAKVEETFKAFDAKLPEVEDVIVTGPRNFDIIFSEPIAKAGTVDIKQDRTKLGNKISKIDDRRVSIDVYSNLQEGREYEVTVTGFEDYAGYKNIINTMKFAYAKDTVPPMADVVKAEQTYVVVEFDKPVKGLRKDQFYHTFNAWNAVGIYKDADYKEPVKETDSVSKVYALFYKVENGKPTSDSRAIPEGNVRFGINGNKVVDNWGNSLGQFEKTISVSADKTVPEVTEIEVVEENLLRIKFNKNVTKPTVEILDENGRKIEKLTWNVSGSGKTYDVKLSKKMEGKVVMVIVKDVMDNTLMENKMATYTEYVEIVDRTRPEIVKAYYDIYKDDPRDKNRITGGKLAVIFDEDVDGDTALNFRSYALVYKEGVRDRVEPLSETPYFDLNSARVMIPLTAKQAEIINDYHKLISPVKLQVIGVKDLAGNEIVPVVHKIDGTIEDVTSVEVLDIYAPDTDRLVVKIADSLSNVKDDYFRISINGTPVDKRYIAINEDQNGGITKLEFVLGDKVDKFPTDLSGVVFEYTPGSKDGVENSFGKVIRKMIAKKGNVEIENRFDKNVIRDKIAPAMETTKIGDKYVDDVKWVENGKNIYIRYTEEIDKYALSSLVFKVSDHKVNRVYRSVDNVNVVVIEVNDNLTKAPEIIQDYPVFDMHENAFKADKPFKATYTGKEVLLEDKEVTATAITEGKKLGESTLSGAFKNEAGKPVKGTLAWDKPDTVVNETGKFSWTFTPEDSKRYPSKKGEVQVKVNPVIKYTVTFDSNGGNEVKAITVGENGTIKLPEPPTKAGYKFIGWYTDNGKFENKFTEETKVTADITVYAKWEEVLPDEIKFGTPSQFLDGNYTRPRILHDGSNYHLWYRTYGGTDIKTYHKTAATIEGLKTTNGTPIKIGNQEQGLDNFFIIRENNQYYLFSSDDVNINIHTSADGVNWTAGKSVFSKVNTWDSGKIDNPMVIKDGNQYKLYYQGKIENGKYQIGLATSTTIDGQYVSSDKNPILKSDDKNALFQPWVVKDGGFYHMWYAAGNGPQSIKYAWSRDGINWTKTDKAIVTAEKGYYGTPTVIKVDNTWHMWFLNESDGSSSVMYTNSAK